MISMKKMGALMLSGVLATSMAFGLTSCSSGSGEKTIAVVAKGESHAFWQSVKAGAEAAGKEKGYKVTFRGPASESAKDLPSQKEMVDTAINNGPAGMVLATIGEGFTDSLKKRKKRAFLLFSSTAVFGRRILKLWAGIIRLFLLLRPVTEMLRQWQRKNSLKQSRLISPHLINMSSASFSTTRHQTGIDRAGGFTDKFKELAEADATTKGKVTIESQVKPGDANNAYKDALEALEQKGAKAIFMSNEGVVKQVL